MVDYVYANKQKGNREQFQENVALTGSHLYSSVSSKIVCLGDTYFEKCKTETENEVMAEQFIKSEIQL